MGNEVNDPVQALDDAITGAGDGGIGDFRQEPDKDILGQPKPEPGDKSATEEPAKKDEPAEKKADTGEEPPAKPSEKDVQNALLQMLNAETPEEAIANAKQKGKDLHDKSMEVGNLRSENQTMRETLAKLTGQVETLMGLAKTGKVQDADGNQESGTLTAIDLVTDPDGGISRIEQAITKGIKGISDRVAAVEGTVQTFDQTSRTKTQQAEIAKTMEDKYGKELWRSYDGSRETIAKMVMVDKTMPAPELYHLAALGRMALNQIRAGKSIVATSETKIAGGMGREGAGGQINEPDKSTYEQEVDALNKALMEGDMLPMTRYD